MDGIIAGVLSGVAAGVLSNVVAHWLQIGADAKRERRDSLRKGFRAIDDLHRWTFAYAGRLVDENAEDPGPFQMVVLEEIVYMDFERLDQNLEQLMKAHNRFTGFVHQAHREANLNNEDHGREGDLFVAQVASFTSALKDEARRKERSWWAPWLR